MSAIDPTGDRRVFLGWDRPALTAAAHWLIDRAQAGSGPIELDALTVAVPSARCARLMLGELIDRASDRPLSPPLLITPTELLDVILGPVPNPAGPGATELAWLEALRSLSPDQLAPLIPAPPEPDDDAAWSGLAGLLAQAHAACCDAMLRFADIPQWASAVPGFAEHDRWAAAALVQERYAQQLESWSLCDPALMHLDRLLAEPEPVAGTLVLVGIADLRPAVRCGLDLLGDRVTSLVAAPESLADRFDELGSLRTEPWAQAHLDLPRTTIEFADRPSDQANRALVWLADQQGPLRADEVVIAVPDPSVAEAIERTADRAAGVGVRAGGVDTIQRTAPWSLLDALARWLEDPSPSSLSDLAHHPDFEAWVVLTHDTTATTYARWLEALDTARTEHLANRLDSLPPLRPSVSQGIESLSRAAHRLADPHTARQLLPIDQLAASLLDRLTELYADAPLRRHHPVHRRTIAALQSIADAMGDLARAQTVRLTMPELLRLVARQIADRTVPDPPAGDAIELLGWLDAAWDPSPVLICTGLNEGIVPSRADADPLMPDALRQALGLACDRDRLAREAFLLQAAASTRRASLIIAGRRSTANDPLNPSRLLFRCPRGELIDRAQRFVDPARDEPRRLATTPPPAAVSSFTPRPIVQTEPVTSMRITDFRAYLRSPYEFYLTRILGLGEVADEARELDPLAFGSLIHDALKAFADSDAAASTDEHAIAAVSREALTQLVSDRYGARPRSEVRLQLELALRRLDSFATWQAARAQAGWRIIAREWSPADPATLDVDGQPMGLRGRIDRIDYHERDEIYAILDYKTGDTVKPPMTTHRKADAWVDLQLPLYRHLAAELIDDADFVLGYVSIPKPSAGTDLLEAAWTPAELHEADEAAQQVIRAIRAGAFDDPGSSDPDPGPLAALLGTGLVGAGHSPSHAEHAQGDNP